MPVTPEDEYLHPAPEGTVGFWSDNLWFSVCDREADVLGVNHIHATNKGYGRWATMLVIDGIPQPWAYRALRTRAVRECRTRRSRLRRVASPDR